MSFGRSGRLIGTAFLVAGLCIAAQAATINKTNNSTNLNLGSSWVGGTAPGSNDIAQWSNTVTSANTVSLGADLKWAGIKVVNPGGAVSITAGNTLDLGSSGLILSNATQDLVLSCALNLVSNQSWNVASGRTVFISNSVSGTALLTNSGTGTVTFNGGSGATYTFGTSGAGNAALAMNAGTVNFQSGTLTLGANYTGTYNADASHINGNSTFNLSGGTVNCSYYTRLGSGSAGTLSTLNVSGGVLNSTGDILFGQLASGSGTLTISGGTVNSHYLRMGDSNGTHTVNLDGGTLKTDWIRRNNATAVFNFNGGLLMVNTNPTSPWFAASVSNVFIKTGGAIIDTAGKNVTIEPNIQPFSGSNGGLTKMGSGTLSLAGMNTYSGATVISNGTLQIGTNGVTGALGGGNVINSAALVFNRSDAITVSNTVSGSGSLIQSGAGVTMLAGANAYAGGTIVSNGALIGSATGCFGSGDIKVAAGATLTLTNSASCIGDQARLILSGSSALNLNFSGADTVGSLSMDGGTNWLPAGTYTAAELGGGVTGSGSLIVTTAILPTDNFSGTPGDFLAGSFLNTGGVWSKAQTDSGDGMNGDFIFASGGGVVASNNSYANIFTAFDASRYAKTFTNGYVLSLTFTANGYTDGDLFMGLAETIDKGYFQNVNTNDLIRFIYNVGGTKAGTFTWSVRDESILLNNDSSTNVVTPPAVNPTDVVRLSITVYPKFGLIFGEATNVTQNYLISKSRIGVNTPGLTNTLYAGMGWINIVTNSGSPAVISSFAITTAPDLTVAKPILMPTNRPPVMTGFAFDDMTNGVANTNFAYILSEHASVDIMHAVGPKSYDTVRATYPDKIMIKQMAWGGTAGIPLENVWPGHCLMKAGTKLTNDCAATTNDTVLYMQDYTRIAASQAGINNHTNKNDADGYALMYALDANGRPDWTRAEHVKLVSLNTTNGSITVSRAQYGTSPQAFTNGQAAIARHMMFWSPAQWEVNLSLESPRGGPFNMTAAEWFALQVAQSIYEAEADGVEMDVGRWMWGYPANNPMDCDNDLVADHGYIDGVNSFGLGGQVLQRQLRVLLGPNRIVQTDGNDALFGQRGWKYMNGVQLESFPTGGYDIYSERFRHFRQWVSSVEARPVFSYPFTKTPTTLFGHVLDTDGSTVDWRFRVGFAAALLTDMPHPFASVTDITFDPANPDYNDPNMKEDKGFYKWDEYVGGDLNDWHWLGAAQGPAIQFSNNVSSTNLLASTVWQWKTESNFISSCSISAGEYSAAITAIPSNTLPWIDKAYYPNSQVPQALWFGTRLEITSGVPVLVTNQEYTLEFEAKGNDSWTVHGDVFDRVPRSLTIDGISSNGFHKPASVFLGPEWTLYRFTIIADSNTPPPLVFGVSEQIGDAAIRNIRLYQGGSERWMREFKNGRLYLNMTRTPWTVNVGTGVVQRLRGTQIPAQNNGVGENGMLTVPVWDAVLLRTWTVDAWKSEYFTSNQLTNAAISGDSADPDSDGFSNYQEYLAGTNPTNAQSRFVFSNGVDRTKVNWSSVSGRVYEVYWTSNLLSSFTPLQTNIVWPQSVYTNAAPGGTGSGFYKMKVRRP